MSSYVWNGASDDWTVAGDWTPSGVPGAADDATIAASGAYTVGIAAGETIAVGSLTLNAADASLQIDGQLSADSLALNAGTLVLAGTLSDTTVIGAGGTVAYNLGTFSNVTYEGTLDLGSDGLLVVENGLKVTDASGTGPGVINVTGGGSAVLVFADAETIDNVTINVGSDTGFNNVNANATGSTLELGAGVVVNSLGLNGLQLGGSAAVTSFGTINAGVLGGTASISTDSFDNAGALNVTNGQTLSISSATFSNTGSVYIDSASELDFQGTIIAATQTVGGTVDIEGTLNANGSTIDLGASGAFAATTLGGTLENAVIMSDGGTATYNLGTLVASTVMGKLDLGDSGLLQIAGGLTVTDATGTAPGVINVIGSGAALIFADDETIDNVTINVGSDTGFDRLNANGSTLELGAGVVLNSVGVNGLQFGGSATVTNLGTIEADVLGGQAVISVQGLLNAGLLDVTGGQTLDVSAATFGNTGSIFVGADSLIDLQGTVVAATQSVGGTVDIEGTFDANGSTIDLGATSAFANTLLGGTLANALIYSDGGVATYNFGTLSNAQVFGTLDLGDSGLLQISNGLTVSNAAGTGAGIIDVTGSAAALIVADSETIDSVTLNVGSDTGFDSVNVNGETLQLGSNVVVNSLGFNGLQLGGSGAVTSFGRINASVAGAAASITTGAFTNAGTLNVTNKQTFAISSASIANTGLINVTGGGSLDIGSALTGTGKIVVGTRSTVEFNDAVSNGQSIAMQGTLVTLVLDTPSTVAARISGFSSSDKIDLVGLATLGSTVKASGTNAVVTGGAAPIALNLGAVGAGKGYGLISDGRGGSDLIIGKVLNGPAAGHATINPGVGNAIINAHGYGNTITVSTCDAVINAGSGGAKVTVGNGSVVVNLSGVLNQVTAGNGNDVVTGRASASKIVLGAGNDQVKLTGTLDSINVGGGDNTVDVTGNLNLIKTGGGSNAITVSGSHDVVQLTSGTDGVALSGSHNVVFLGSGAATITDAGKGLNVVANKGVGHEIISGVGSDPSFVLDLVGGVGGYHTAAQAYAALTSDGNGGSLLALGATGSVDFAGVTTAQLSSHNFAVVPSFHV